MVANSFGNRNFMQLMGRLSMHSKCLDFFPFKFWVGVGEDFFHFSFVPNKFPSSSQWVPIRFPICSQGSQCVPNSTSFESHMFCPKSSPSHLYRWAKGGGIPSLHRIFYVGKASTISTFDFAMGQSNWLIAKKKLDM
jgi:hypothetical protein